MATTLIAMNIRMRNISVIAAKNRATHFEQNMKWIANKSIDFLIKISKWHVYVMNFNIISIRSLGKMFQKDVWRIQELKNKLKDPKQPEYLTLLLKKPAKISLIIKMI